MIALTNRADLICAIGRAHSDYDGTVFVRNRVKVIDRFEITGNFFLGCFIDIFLHAVEHLLHFHSLLCRALEPIDSGRIRTKIESQRRIIAQKARNRGCVSVVDQQGRLVRRSRIRDDIDLGAGHGRFGARFNFFE